MSGSTSYGGATSSAFAPQAPSAPRPTSGGGSAPQIALTPYLVGPVGSGAPYNAVQDALTQFRLSGADTAIVQVMAGEYDQDETWAVGSGQSVTVYAYGAARWNGTVDIAVSLGVDTGRLEIADGTFDSNVFLSGAGSPLELTFRRCVVATDEEWNSDGKDVTIRFIDCYFTECALSLVDDARVELWACRGSIQYVTGDATYLSVSVIDCTFTVVGGANSAAFSADTVSITGASIATGPLKEGVAANFVFDTPRTLAEGTSVTVRGISVDVPQAIDDTPLIRIVSSSSPSVEPWAHVQNCYFVYPRGRIVFLDSIAPVFVTAYLRLFSTFIDAGDNSRAVLAGGVDTSLELEYADVSGELTYENMTTVVNIETTASEL